MLRSYTFTAIAFSLLLIVALISVWISLTLPRYSVEAGLRVFLIIASGLGVSAAGLYLIPWRVFREQERRIAEMIVAVNARRRLPSGVFSNLTFAVNGLIDESSELRRKSHTLEETSARDERLVELGQFVAALSHEIRNPLTAISGYAALLLEKELDPEIKEDIRAIHRDARRCEHLMNSVLQFARTPRIEPGPVSVAELAPRDCGIEVRLLGDSSLRLLGDSVLLGRVFSNLADNARLAGAKSLDIHSSRSGSNIRLEISDDGSGIPSGILEKLFQPFATTRSSGTGLGLAFCRKTIEAHGGTIQARNRPEGGAQFEIHLPVR